jgi:hypothetical protein
LYSSYDALIVASASHNRLTSLDENLISIRVGYLDGKCELRCGSKEDRLAAKEWISMFWHEIVVREV